jgi:7,8-dihydroneopterin aldolase/epimerase/oxygenase
MWHIALQQIKLYAYHGVYAQEQALGNWFVIDIKVTLPHQPINTLSDSINYEVLYNIVRLHMSKPQQLLEQVIQLIVHDVQQQLPKATYLHIKIAKQHVAIGKQVGASVVEWGGELLH